ncbi:MAG: hypothetical protein FDX21_08165 [Chlorobium sp.]|nr:MAG: hypothetical protein FDX21_08165 [Chlorobium sp.]
MDQKTFEYKNLILFVALALFLSLVGAFYLYPDILLLCNNIIFNLGMSMFGTLFGLLLFFNPKKSNYFSFIKPNHELDKQYWIEFIHGIDEDPKTVWFVGDKSYKWIDPKDKYFETVNKKIISRLTQKDLNSDKDGWCIHIIVSDIDSANKWKKLIEEMETINKSIKNKRVKIGLLTSGKIKYSIVAYHKKMVIVTFMSNGHIDNSPTFEINRENLVYKAYLNDLDTIYGDEKITWLLNYEKNIIIE